jgi:2-polyprenyl-3-methyl-5-hydroxy-6-metoxy-1,4-benzoquinol methylase
MSSSTTDGAAAETTSSSYESTRERFGTPGAAATYARRHGGHSRDRREQGCIARALAGVAPGSKVLDLPCGAGRLAAMLAAEMRFELTEADASPHMVDQAKLAWQNNPAAKEAESRGVPPVKFETRDVMKSGFPDRAFDVVICNRLLHHFVERDTRIAAFRELARIAKDRVVVSFFNSFALDAIKFRLTNAIRRRTPTDRVPIPLEELRANAAEAGLKLEHAIPTRWGVSPQWYVVFRV